MMPLPLMLQSLPQDTDLLMLVDPMRSDFRSPFYGSGVGISSLHRSLDKVMAQYSEVVALWTSGGGFPAVRFAKNSALKRGISIGGRGTDDTLDILRKRQLYSADDPLCNCNPAQKTQAVYIYGALHTTDKAAAETCRPQVNSHLLPIANRREHVILWSILLAGKLGEFWDTFLDTQSSPTQLRSMIDTVWS